ncbi:MAG: HAMP domain-containing sensor histidine kinase [Solirubrobacteraceae bacterium]
MKTGSLARRTVVATLGVLVLALGGFATLITLRYRDGLRARARSQLLAGARAVTDVPLDQIKPLFASLALEGIDVQLGGGPPDPAKPGAPQGAPVKPGTPSSAGNLLTLTEQINVGGKPDTATLSTSEASVDSAVNRLVVIELVGAAAVLVAATILTLLASRSALRPLRHVAGVAQRISAGDHRQRLEPRRPETELGQMAASFDAMVDSLEEAVAQATRSEAAMRRFLADASHELRTPIAALQATIETLLREQPPRPRRDQLEAEVARGTQRLGRLVDDLLNLARLEANEPLRSEDVDLAQIGESLVAETGTRTPASISIAHDGPAVVVGDPEALTRLLRNLIDNAVHAAGDDGRIVVELERTNHHVRASVSDDGPGVPPEERERIFQGFVRLNGSGGTGLGLAIARAIAEQHHGTVDCEKCDSGARFTLELPAA